MMVDTQFFDSSFKHKLLASIDDIDAETDGILIKGENFQALNLLMEKYRNRIHSIYIDPPYNTGNEFVYKDNYQHSSWLSMMENRLSKAEELLTEDGLFFSSIDDNELHNLAHLLDDTFGEQVNLVVVRNNPKGRGLDQYLAKSHDYLLTYAKQSTEIAGIPKSEDQIAEQYNHKDDRGRYRLQPLRNTHREFNRETRPNLWYPLYVDPETNDVYLEPGDDREEVYPIWDDGLEGCWTWDPQKAERDLDLLVGRKSRGRWKVYRKDYARKDGSAVTYTPKTIWDDNEMRTDHAQQILDDIMGDRVFRSPKPPALIKRALQLSTGEGNYVLDFFAGSGTTAQSVIELNREREDDHNYILVDLGDHLDEVAKPRIQKLVYADEWDDGTPQNTNGVSHMFKYQELESYEDSLDNISFTGERQAALDTFDDYFLRYMLEFESRESETRLNIDKLSNPFEYQLQLTRNGERETEQVDLIETFNYLIGLDVDEWIEYEHQGRPYRVVRGQRGEESVTVIWRNTEDLDLSEEEDFVKDEILTDEEDVIYLNSDSLIEDARSLESVFKNRMEA
jgi:adenine-specific DNA-methyltransferase